MEHDANLHAEDDSDAEEVNDDATAATEDEEEEDDEALCEASLAAAPGAKPLEIPRQLDRASPSSYGAVAPPPSTKSTLPMGLAESFDGSTIGSSTTRGFSTSIKFATEAVCDAISSSSSVGTT